jgi:hypothetical protein
MERRINASANEHNKLKAVAGMMQSLSYREMREFAELIYKQGGLDISEDHVANALLRIADEILARPEPRR